MWKEKLYEAERERLRNRAKILQEREKDSRTNRREMMGCGVKNEMKSRQSLLPLLLLLLKLPKLEYSDRKIYVKLVWSHITLQ